MKVRNAIQRLLTILACLAIPLAAHAAPSASFFYSPTSIPLGGTSAMLVSISEDSGGTFTGGTLQITYDPNIVNTGAINFDTCGLPTTAAPGTSQIQVTNISLTPFFSCTISLQVTASSPGAFTTTLSPGNLTMASPPASNSNTVTDTLTVVSPTVVTNTADSGVGSLRDAINTVNGACFNGSSISFNIPGSGPRVIGVLTALPAVTCNALLIDGYTQPGASPNTVALGSGNDASIMVVLDGSACSGCSGLTLTGDGVTVNGLSIHSFPGSGIISSQGISTSNVIAGNFIGTDPGGVSALGNGGWGVRIDGGFGFVGPSTANPGDRNLISNNVAGGIIVNGSTAAASINNNQVGGKSDGSSGNGNGGPGIFFSDANYSSNFASRNRVQSNGAAGIAISAGTITKVVVDDNESSGNAGIGIDFRNDGPTSNDETLPYDTDGVQNYPVVTSVAQIAGNTLITGYLKTSAFFRTATVLLYANSDPNPAITEGEINIANVSVTTDVNGDGTFSLSVPGTWDNVTAQITIDTCGDGCDRSSEYSPKFTIPVPALSLSATSLDFGAWLTGTNSTPLTLTLTNTGNTTLNIFSFATALPFNVVTPSSTCGATLAAAASCTYDLGFSPTTAGTFSGSFTLSTDAPATPTATVTLAGIGMQPPTFSLATTTALTPGQTVPIAIQISNPIANTVSFGNFTASLAYPAGYVNAAPGGGLPAGGCGDPSFTGGVAGGNTIGFAGAGSVAPGATCSIVAAQVVGPASTGSYTFTIPAGGITVASPFVYTNPAPITVTAVVSPAPAPGVTISPASVSFPSQVISVPSTAQTVSIINTGTAPLHVTSVTTSGDFSNTAACAAPIAPGPTNACVFTVTFTPTAAGPRTGTLTVASDAAGSPHTIPLSGTGLALTPAVSLTPPSLAFASRTVGTTSPPQTITMANTGNGPLSITSITGSGDFAFASSCGATLAALASCAINVTFTPLAAGPRAGSLVIVDNAPGSPRTVPLSGSGVAGVTAVPMLSPGSLDFEAQAVGSTSPVQLVVVSNAGTGPLAVGPFSVTGEFAIAAPPATAPAPCPATLGPGSACSIGVVFRPAGTNLRQGVLTIGTDAGSLTVNVVGIGMVAEPPQLTMPLALDFGSRTIGIAGDGLALPMHNTSPYIAAIHELTATGDFDVSDTCATILAGDSCSLLVTFLPTQVGARTGTLTVRTMRDANPYVVSLTGVGIENVLPSIQASPIRVGFGNVFVGGNSSLTVTLRNAGRGPLHVSGILFTGDYSAGPSCVGTIQPGGSCAVNVTFSPMIPGGRQGVMRILSDDPNGELDVSLSGAGCYLPTPSHARAGLPLCGS